MFFCPALANATIVPVDQWLLGDSDSPAAVLNGNGDATTVNGIGGRNLTKVSDANGPYYVAGGAAGSAFAMNFTNASGTQSSPATATEYYKYAGSGTLATSNGSTTGWGADCWVYLPSQPGSTTDQVFLDVGGYNFRIIDPGTGTSWGVSMLRPGNWEWGTTVNPPFGSWFHFCYVTDGSTARMYINGTQIGTHSSPPTSVANNVTVGCQNDNDTNSTYDGGLTGAVDDVPDIYVLWSVRSERRVCPRPRAGHARAAGLRPSGLVGLRLAEAETNVVRTNCVPHTPCAGHGWGGTLLGRQSNCRSNMVGFDDLGLGIKLGGAPAGCAAPPFNLVLPNREGGR